MDIDRVRCLQGTNIWADFPVTEVWLDINPIADEALVLLARRLRTRLPREVPGCRAPRLAKAQDRMGLELWLARTFGQLIQTLGIQLGGAADAFLRVAHSGQPGLVQIVYPHQTELAPRACAETAMALFRAVQDGAAIDLPAALAGIEAAAAAARPTQTLAALSAAARRRDVPVRDLGSGLLQLGYGVRQVRIQGTRSERLGAVAQWITGERDLMEDLLASTGVACTEAPETGSHYRLLVAGGRVIAGIHWQPASGGVPRGGLPVNARNDPPPRHQ